MFLGKMVKDFFDSIKNTNQTQAIDKPLDKPTRTSYKPNRKTDKSKKSQMKSSLNMDEQHDQQLPQTSSGKMSKTDANKPLIPTKVKSGSWKRSDKSIAPFNTLPNKKHKNLRKKSPNWLKFPNSKMKIHEAAGGPLTRGGRETTSACRPGTLYSDVLFGAGCSNLVKIKNVTPRNGGGSGGNSTATAQKKLTKALFKFNGNNNNEYEETSDESEIEANRNLFPSLQKINNKISLTPPLLTSNTDSPEKIPEMSATCSSKNMDSEEPNAVILSDFKDLCLSNNNVDNFEGHFQHLNGKIENEAGPSSSCYSTATINHKFLVSSISDIPKWNFMNADTEAEAFPKFLGQFDDEHYLKAEKIAWLGLKLALGNNSLQK